ncbi:MalY/PatB family protein [Cellulosilyticum sp. I15G10I2]|uniref:MalY/PatB family protein n=1 Tax=Cellulosilyticum sp. I15G10I2 TaxID=1892843 RepID=UPI00085C150C|nr:MalY/PatB family protein [Cellulosilyticum sp. I15G10I2]
MDYNFDKIIDRRNTDSIKYDFALRRGKPDGILPLWVADMDFQAPPAVIDALTDKSLHGIFGYSENREDYIEVLQNWFASQFDWHIEPNWLVKTPSVVYAICTAIRALTNKGDAVLIQQPVYYPFAESVLINERMLVINELVYSNGRYFIDFEDFENKIKQNNVKLFILCSPHNPVGRVWTQDELIRMGDICTKHGVIVVSDEIHADFIYENHIHSVFANLKPEFSDITVTCTAPTKTFNLAALQISNIFIENRAIRHKFKKEVSKSGYSQLNIMGITACKAAYSNGLEWLMALRTYLVGNLEFARTFLSEKLPQIKLVEPEGTYLIWLDFKELGLSEAQLEDLIVNKAKLWLDAGEMFGAGGAGFQRINIACPRSILEQAFIQLEEAVSQL